MSIKSLIARMRGRSKLAGMMTGTPIANEAPPPIPDADKMAGDEGTVSALAKRHRSGNHDDVRGAFGKHKPIPLPNFVLSSIAGDLAGARRQGNDTTAPIPCPRCHSNTWRTVRKHHTYICRSCGGIRLIEGLAALLALEYSKNEPHHEPEADPAS